MNKLSGKILLITEASCTIGKTTALLAAKEGAVVICTANHTQKIDPLISEIKEKGGVAVAFHHDSRSRESWKEILSKIVSTYGKIDSVVNCTSITSPKMLSDLTSEDLNTIQDTTINSFVYGLKETLPVMMTNHSGSIINISTLEGLVGLKEHNPYTAFKDVLRSYTLDAAYEYAPYNIRVNSICPIMITTPLLETTFPMNRSNYKKYTQYPDFGQTENVAKWIIYLASDEASFITGAEIVIDSDQIIM
jgi:NAD(P)-dependent dehydrogenase (short-subunit alcohol dehydrogenase family)